MRMFTDPVKILDAVEADGIGVAVCVKDYRHLFLTLDTASDANLVVKFQGSIAKDMPDFAAAQTAANQWDYVEVKDLEDASAIDGDTGITLGAADDHRHFEVNTNHLNWLCAIVSSYVAGAATLKCIGMNDQ